MSSSRKADPLIRQAHMRRHFRRPIIAQLARNGLGTKFQHILAMLRVIPVVHAMHTTRQHLLISQHFAYQLTC
jgi:hypothetical protein